MAQTGTNVASTSQVVLEWQPTFQLDGKPFLVITSVQVWDKGKGGRVAQSLVHSLLLPNDVHAFEDGTEESMGKRLQWHTVVVIPCFTIYHLLLHKFFLFSYLSLLPHQAPQLAYILDGQLKS